ncbi:MAG: hypothetical protein K1X89_22245 [Myxococcaceae bacterium]|nr:hypothetical protein [Myxococcaceae bacterium]
MTCVLAGCPKPNPTLDAGPMDDVDGGNPEPIPACSGGCAANQICDKTKRVCIDACNCDAGICTKQPSGDFKCVAVETKCSGNQCDPGQVACADGQCTCLPTSKAAQDSCATQGQWCRGTTCTGPRRYQECKQDIGGCPADHTCNEVFTDTFLCVKQCTSVANCDRGELCNGGICLPQSLFTGGKCAQFATDADGGKVQVTVPRGNTCLLKAANGAPTESTPTGNCQYQFFEFYDQGVYPFDVCRPPGTVNLGDRCKQDYAPTAVATQCNTGLECALTRSVDEGVCLKTCNAVESRNGLTPQPACATTEACVNIYRQFDVKFNSVLGTCMAKCSVFDKALTNCANIGSAPTSCVPTDPTGTYKVSNDGSGICVPQQATVAKLGESCSTSDPFRGAACANGLICTSLTQGGQSTCFAPCDLGCTGANPPARCASEANATCGAGKTCTVVNTGSSSIMGLCN